MKNLIQAAVVTLFAASSVQAQQAVQWKVSDGGNGHWYGITTASSTWPAVRDWCVTQGGHLATVTSQQEWQWLKASLPVVGSFVGAFQDHSDPAFSEPYGGWKWVSGEPFVVSTYMAMDDCPGGHEGSCGCVGDGNQDVLFFTGCCGNWLDDVGDGIVVNCDSVSRNGVIEWDADCNHDGIVDYGQILSGQLVDSNQDGIPDVCQCGSVPNLPACCIGDILVDGIVNGADLGALLSYWGVVTSSPVSRACDLNADGRVDGSDLGMLLANWGTCH